MQKETNSLDGILDITLPLAPIDSGWSDFITVSVIIALSVISIGVACYWWQTPRQRCKRKLGKLLHRHKDGQIDSHQAVFKLAKIMRVRVHCHQLSSKHDLPMHLQQHQSRWCEFINELNAARYSGLDIDALEFNKLASETDFWVGRW